MTDDSVIRGHIDESVKEFIDAGKMFTAFEISLAVKAKGVRARHRDMRSYVHESIHDQAGQNYTRTLRDVGAPTQAWVYHRLRANPHEYVPLDRDGHAPAVTGRVAPAPRNPSPLAAASSAAPVNASDGAFGTDQEGRLVISASVLDGLGVGPGDTVNITHDAENQEIRLSRPSMINTAAADSTADVDDDGKLRIGEDDLKEADLDGMQCYRIIGRGNLVTIRDFS